jgi:type IV secretion system protein VirD4
MIGVGMADTKKSDAAKFSMFLLFMFLFCMVVASSVATQWFAAKLAYQAALGDPLLSLDSGMKIYIPFMWIVWGWRWAEETGVLKTYVTTMQVVVLAGGAVAVAIGGWLYYRRSLQGDGPSDLHGSAHFATDDEIAKTKLITHGGNVANGVYCGSVATKWGQMALRHDGPEHVIVFAPTRSGKGVGLVLPTLYSWQDSCVIHDIKGENWALTAGFRQAAGQKVLKFEPTCTDGSGARFNPLSEVRLFTTSDVKDAQNIASMIVDPEGKGLEDHWAKTSFALLSGVILHVMYAEKEKSLAGVAFYLSDPSFSHVDQMFLRMVEAEHDPEGKM